jgi:sulfur carrier protein
MNVHVNGAAREVAEGSSVQALVALLGMDPSARGVAVALDARVVPRARWKDTEVGPGSRVEVVTAMQGG